MEVAGDSGLNLAVAAVWIPLERTIRGHWEV